MKLIDVLLGLQYGDEGKGKIIDTLARHYDIIVRPQGGDNAGHTLVLDVDGYKGEQIILHTVPSGIMHPKIMNLIGSGVVFNPISFIKEITECSKYDKGCASRVKISDRAVLVPPLYLALDILLELEKGKSAIGTTNRGIGVAYAERDYRNAMLVKDILLPKVLFLKKYADISTAIHLRIAQAFMTHGIDFFKVTHEKSGKSYKEFFSTMEREWAHAVEKIKDMGVICDTVEYIHRALQSEKRILSEGAQGTMLDIIHGDYPNVTSSSVISGGVCGSLGVPPSAIGRVIGVIKHYSTKVGSGVFPGRMDEVNEGLFRKAGHEYGATTGRPRNCGWLDLVQLKYACTINGVTELIVLKTDVIPVEIIKMVMMYATHVGKMYTNLVPSSLSDVSEVVTKDFPAWKILPGITNKKLVPQELANYLDFIEHELGVPITHIGTGPHRDHLVEWKEKKVPALIP